MTRSFNATLAGCRVLGRRNDHVELRCAPDLGGRVFSLMSRRTGREWLWRQRRRPDLFAPADPLDFGTGTFAGLDECLPTVGACPWPDGSALGDHGNIWARPWRIDDQRDGIVALSVEVPPHGLRLTRTIRLADHVVRFDYALENPGTGFAPALWAMHPLFTYEPGDRLELPAGVDQLLVESARPELPRVPPDAGSRLIAYPEPAPGVRLDALELPDVRDGFLKAFTPALPSGVAQAALANDRSRDRLEVRWDTTYTPHLGLWLTRGGYRGWHHVALEPTCAPHDRADVAAADPAAAPLMILPAGAVRRWWVEWHVA